MSAGYVISGALLGAVLCRTTYDNPQWAFLLIPAAAAFIVGAVLEAGGRR